jgi:predicted  nucleic acid-binding Zn-ribbon protein
MCRAGLLTEEQLEHALSVQESTSRPLGEVIVKLGYASPGAVANALAEQYGGTLRTEYGVSTGLGSGFDAPPPPPRLDDVPAAPARIVSLDPSAAEPPDAAEDAAVAEAAREAELVGIEERARAAEGQVEGLQARLEELEQLAAGVGEAQGRAQAAEGEAASLRSRMAELEQAAASAGNAQGRAEAAESETASLRSRIAELEQAATAARVGQARAERAEGEAESLRSRVAELEQAATAAGEAQARAEAAEREAESLRTRIAELEIQIESARVPEPAAEEEHLLFVPSPTGYSLARGGGACPEPGARVEHADGRAWVVARIGPSPIGNRLRCAYLEPAP